MRMRNPRKELRSRFFVRAKREACTYWIKIRKRLATMPWRRRSSRSLRRFCIFMAMDRVSLSRIRQDLALPKSSARRPAAQAAAMEPGSRLPRFITRPSALQQFGNCCRISSRRRKRRLPRSRRALGDPALRSFTGNSFGSLPAAGRPGDITWPSTSRPPGTPAGPEELSTNDPPCFDFQSRHVLVEQNRFWRVATLFDMGARNARSAMAAPAR